MKGERFLPFRRTDVVAMCAEELPASERDGFRAFGRMLASLLHHRFHERIEVLKDAYHPFHPEADTRTVQSLDHAAREASRARLEAELIRLAEAANFTQMSLEEVVQAMRAHSLLKLRLEIDTRDVDQLLLFRRGESTDTRTEKRLFGLLRKSVTYVTYARVLVYAKFKDANGITPEEAAKLPYRPGSIIVKLFQNVPREDLEMIFPNVRIRMRPIDKLLIGIPALISGISVVVFKLVAAMLPVLLLIAFWLRLKAKEPDPIDQAKLLALGAGLFALGTYGWRQFNNFKNRKILFMKALSENLYYRNLDNDAGVFHHLLDAAEEAEVIEALLAYHFLLTAAAPQTAAELDQRVEQWFLQRWNTRFDFEVDDGLRKLLELGLVTASGGAGAQQRLVALPVDAATALLDRLWDDAYTYAEPATVQQPALARPAS
jgi:hypothetical protein